MQSADVLTRMGSFEDADLREIATSIEKAGRGELSERAAFDAISRIVRRRTEAASDIYQKPLG